MKRLIVLMLLVLAVTIGAATASTTVRITNVGGGWNPLAWGSSGQTSITAYGASGGMAYYRDNLGYSLSGYTRPEIRRTGDRGRGGYQSAGSSFQIQGQTERKSVTRGYGSQRYRTYEYGDTHVRNVQLRTDKGGFYMSRNAATGKYSGGANVGTPNMRRSTYATTYVGGGSGANMYRGYQLPMRPRSAHSYGWTPRTVSASVSTGTVYN